MSFLIYVLQLMKLEIIRSAILNDEITKFLNFANKFRILLRMVVVEMTWVSLSQKKVFTKMIKINITACIFL